VQIFGGQPERMRAAAEMAEEIGADILDINCGCPAPKVVKHGGGSGLLRDLPRLETILKEIKKAITIPMTIKIRAGYSNQPSMPSILRGSQKIVESSTLRCMAAPGTRLSWFGGLGFGARDQTGRESTGVRERRCHDDPTSVRSFSRDWMRWSFDRPRRNG